MERSSQPAHALAHAAALKKWKISTLGPRYTRPFEGHALLLHSCSELPDEQRAENTTKQQAGSLHSHVYLYLYVYCWSTAAAESTTKQQAGPRSHARSLLRCGSCARHVTL